MRNAAKIYSTYSNNRASCLAPRFIINSVGGEKVNVAEAKVRVGVERLRDRCI